MQYRTCGRSGLKLPVLSLGLWHNFGGPAPTKIQRDLLRTAFDLGITHFDLANNYGPPYGSAETNFGQIFRTDFRRFRDELIISTKVGSGWGSTMSTSSIHIVSMPTRRLRRRWAPLQPPCSRARRFTSASH